MRFPAIQTIRFRPGVRRRTRRPIETPDAAYRISLRNRGLSNASRNHRNGNRRQAAAWTLSKRYPVTVHDRDIRPGGHSHTVTIDYDGTPLAVDIGFIVYNELNYLELKALFAHLGVETVESCMSFAVTADNGRFEWKGGGPQLGRDHQGIVRAAAQPVVTVVPVDAA